MRLLIVGNLDGHISTASKIALSRGANVSFVDDIQAALTTLRSGQGADLVMFDVNMSVKAMVDSLKAERFSIPVIACGIGTDSKIAVQAIKAGAKEYIPLPPDHELIAAVFETVSKDETNVVYRDPKMKQLLQLAKQIAPSDASVLITGESGTGKEVMARYIHRQSNRASHKFISVNCAAIPENLLESELFGHEKGAFTGAVARRIGKFEEANGGTLLLDEISEMDPALQAKLLRAIQEREIDRVGGSSPVKINIRILATSNRDLEEAVKNGTFREDLYFRLNVVPIQIPALRERLLDIEMLANHFIKKYSQENSFPLRPLSNRARDLLQQHVWKGNVRELENTMHRAVLLASGDEISDEAIMLPQNHETSQNSEAIKTSPQNVFIGRTVSEVERDLIIGTLSHCLGNRTQAAHILGISIRTLRNKLRQYSEEGMKIPSPGEAYQQAM